MKKIVLILCLAALIVAFLFIPHTIELTGTLETWFPYKGLTLYKDISMFHFPIGRFILVPLHLLSNWNLKLDPFLGLGVGLFSLYTIYIFGKKYLSPFGTIVAMLFFTTFFWYFATAILYYHEMLIGLLLGLALLVFYNLKTQKRQSSRLLFLLGLLLSLAEFSGQVASITVFVFAILALVKFKFSRYLICGLLTPPAILCLYFLSQNALAEFIYWNTAYYFITYASFTNTPLSELPWRELSAFFLPVGLLLVSFRQKLLLFLGLSTMPFIIFSIFHFHHLSYALPTMALLAGLATDSLPKSSQKYLSILIFCLLSFSIYSWHKQHIRPKIDFKIVNDVYPGDPMYSAIDWVKQNTNVSDKLMVFGDPLFYMRADRLPASRPAKSIPYSWEPLEPIINEIRSTPADYWIVDRRSMDKIVQIYKKPKMAAFVDEELTAQYQVVATFEIWEIWKRINL